jgi:transcription initiation factor TFIID subunit 9B
MPSANGIANGASPPSSQTATQSAVQNTSQSNGADPSSSSQPQSSIQPPQHPTQVPTDPTIASPPTSLLDNGLDKRPRDARLIHLVLANLGVTAYQERVPLQLLDFAYRYTSSTLQDAVIFSQDAPPEKDGAGKAAGKKGEESVPLSSIKLAIASRLNHQFSASLPKEFLMEMAQERNRVALPHVGREWGVRLPPERYCLTGTGWGLREEWESEGEDGEDAMEIEEGAAGEGRGEGGLLEEDDGEEEEGEGKMEDLFGGDEEMKDA